jgi:hypothetical protein
MRKVIFKHSTGWGEHNSHRETIEFEDGTTDEEVEKAFQDWVWEQIGDYVTWYDKEEA